MSLQRTECIEQWSASKFLPKPCFGERGRLGRDVYEGASSRIRHGAEFVLQTRTVGRRAASVP